MDVVRKGGIAILAGANEEEEEEDNNADVSARVRVLLRSGPSSACVWTRVVPLAGAICLRFFADACILSDFFYFPCLIVTLAFFFLILCATISLAENHCALKTVFHSQWFETKAHWRGARISLSLSLSLAILNMGI